MDGAKVLGQPTGFDSIGRRRFCHGPDDARFLSTPAASLACSAGPGRSEKRALLPFLRDLTLAYARRCKVSTRPDRPVFPGRFCNDALSPRYVTRLITRRPPRPISRPGARSTRCATATPGCSAR